MKSDRIPFENNPDPQRFPFFLPFFFFSLPFFFFFFFHQPLLQFSATLKSPALWLQGSLTAKLIGFCLHLLFISCLTRRKEIIIAGAYVQMPRLIVRSPWSEVLYKHIISKYFEAGNKSRQILKYLYINILVLTSLFFFFFTFKRLRGS